MKRGLLLWILVLLGVFVPFRPAGASEEKTLTLMVYMAGSDLETQGGAASADIQEMLAAGCDFSRVNLIILTGGAERWQLGFSPEELSVLQLGARGQRVIQRWPKSSMGEPETLSSFLNYAEQAFPALDYALIFWNHGGGPMEGVCYDELYHQDRLTLPELGKALSDSPFGPERPLAWIGFDACMMASVETAHICADYARYMIASQETEPAMGWNYSFLSRMADQPSGAEIGRIIVDAYMEAAPDNRSLTLSCTDLDRLGEVKLAMSDFFRELRNGLNAETFSALSNHRRDAKSFGRTTTLSDYDLADLYHLSEQYASQVPTQAATLQAALESVVVYNSSHQENAHGLSIYSPYYNKNSYTDHWLSAFRELDFPAMYLSWISRYASFWLGDQLADWSNLTGRALPVEENGVQSVEMSLTPEQQEHFASAKLVILRDQGYDNSFFQIYEIADLQPEEGILRADYDYRGLFVFDENGNIVSDLYPFYTLPDGQLAIVAELEKMSRFRSMVLIDRNEFSAEKDETRFVNLVCTVDPDSGALEVRDVIMQPEDPSELTTGKQYVSIDPSEYPYIFFSANRYAYFLTRDEDTGRLLPYTQWPSGDIPLQDLNLIDADGEVISFSEWTRGYHEQTADAQSYLFFSEVDNSKPWSIRFLEKQYSHQPLFAQFIVTDTQGVESATELIPLYSPAVKDSQAFDLEFYRDEEVAMTLESIQVVQASSGSGLYFNLRIENHTDFELEFLPFDLCLNHTMIDYTILNVPNKIAAHSEMRETMLLPSENIPFLADSLSRVAFSGVLWASNQIQEYSVISDPVELETLLDVSSLGLSPPGSGTCRAENSAGDLTVRLLDLKEKKDGSVGGILHFDSALEETIDLSFFMEAEDYMGDAIVNGCFFRNSLHASHAFLLLPPGHDLYIPFTLNRMMQLEPVGKSAGTSGKPFPSGDGFAYWGISGIESLSLPLNINGFMKQLFFFLSEPLPLRFASAEASSREMKDPPGSLLREAPLTLSLRSVTLSPEGHVRLLTDVQNISGQTLCFRAIDCKLDGCPADAQYLSETYLRDDVLLSGWITVTEAEGAHRMLIDLAPGEPGITLSSLSEIRLTFEMATDPGSARYGTELDWRRTEEILISRPGDPAGPEGWKIRSGSMLPLLNLGSLLGGDPAVPDHVSDYACTLRIPLSTEQLQNIQSATIALVLPSEGMDQPETCFSVALLNQCYLDGNDLAADFCGVLASAAGSSYPCCQAVRREGENWRFLASWLDLQAGEDAVLFAEHVLLTLSGENTSAVSGQYEVTVDFSLLSRPLILSDYLEVYSLPAIYQGNPPHYDLWEYLGIIDDTVSLPEDGPAFIFRSATDWENLQAVFSVTNADGSRYALSRPYRECIFR